MLCVVVRVYAVCVVFVVVRVYALCCSESVCCLL